MLESNGVIFGAGLVPASNGTPFGASLGAHSGKNGSHDLHRYDVRKGEAVGRLRWLESRVRHLHPALASVRITHRWGELELQDGPERRSWFVLRSAVGPVRPPVQEFVAFVLAKAGREAART